VQGTSEKLSTSIATSAEGAIKQKVVKGAFDPIFRLLPDGILFGLFSKQIQGGALRYHLKKALSRSLNYDDFKIKLEKELKRTNFNSNTSRLIDEFMQNLEDFNREKEQFLQAKRAEEARIKEEERKRAEEIYKRQEEIYQAQEANNLKDILEAEEKPLKDEFGINFEGFKGKEAIEKLLEEQRGQVKGAFYKEGLGEIDLVWGDKNYGLEHILNKHGGEFKNLARELSEAVENGKIVKDDKGRLRLEYENKIVGIKDNWKGEKTAHWVVTAYVKKEKEASLYTSASFTKGEALPLNSKESIAQKALNLHEKLYLKDNDTPLNVEYKIVNKDDIKPTFTLSKTQFRSQKQEDLIKKIKENFNPDLLVNIRGDLKKGNPIITKDGEVISGNHRAAALKELEGENLAKYQNAVKEAFGVELKENEMLVRVADTSEAEIRRFSAASNEGLENNLGEQGVSLFAKYQDKIKALKEAKKPFVADDVYNLKYLVNKALGESSITKENDTSKALFASLARGRNNTILKALNELEKENLEQVSKVANMFFDNAGAFYNLTHDLDLPKMQNLQNYFSDVLVSAAKADFTRAEDFARLNEGIRAFLDSGDKNAMLKLSPNLVSDLLAKAMGAGFARFARLENPSASLYEFLNGLKAELIEKGMPDLFSGGKGIKLNERDEFDFAKELILKGQDSEEKFRLYQNLEELKAWSGEQKNTKLNTALKALDEVDESKLSEDQKELLRLFKGEIKSVKIQIKDLKDIYTLNQGSRKEGAKKILIKHYGEEKTGGLSSDELLSLKEVIKKGKINLNSLEIKDDFLRYGYDYEKDGVKLRVVIDEFKDGKKVFDYYSDRNFNHYEQGGYKPDLPTPSEIIPQNAKTSPYPQNADEAVRLETISKQELEQSNPQQSHLSTDESMAQNSEKLPFETQTLDEDKLSGDEVRLLANKIGEKSTMAYFKDYLLKMDKNFHARAKDIIREYYKIEPFRKELENQWENVKEAYKNGEMSLKEFKFLSRYKDEKSFLNQVAGVLWLQNDELVKNRGYTINKYGLTEQGKGDNYYQNLALEYGKAQTALKKWFYYIQKANKQAQRFFNKKELEDLRANEKGTKLEAKGSEDIIFTDKKGKEHTLTKETQKAWLEAFNLKSLDEAYIPNFKAEVKEALKSVLNDEEIRLTKGSLIKLIKEKRLKYLDRIKLTLENPHSVILQNDGALIFARDYGEEKYFTSVARNDSGEWIIRSNAPKSKNGLNNKILNGGKEIYNDQAASQINASNPYDDIANSNIKLDNESIAQNSHYLELVKEYGEENAKRIIKQKILGENIAQVLENEEEKFIYKKGDREFEFKIKDAMGQFEMRYDELNLKSDLNKSFLKALNKLKIGYEVLENEPVRIRYFKQEAKERKPKETKPSANKTLGQIQKDMSARLKELKAQAKENYERYKNEDKALQKELTNTKDLFKAFEKEFNETEGTILISRAKRRKNDAEGKVETSVFLGNELALRNALDRWERYSGYSEENALEVKERLELLRSYVKRLEKHREDIRAKREQLEQDYQQNEATRSKEMGVIGNYKILSNLKGVSENELYEPFLEKVGGYLSKADFYERHLPFAREEFQKLFNITPLEEFGTNYAEFYRDGKGAVEKLLAEKQGQVAGAFYKEGLGEIDLVWGDEKIGLKKIIEKHLSDFENFGGKDEAEKMVNALNEIIENGKIITENGINTLWLKKDDEYYLIGLSRGWSGKGENEWIITSYKKTKGKIPDELKGDTANLSAYSDEFNPLLTSKDEPLNSKDIIPQQKIKFAMEKFHYDENKAKDLLEWHKNSHALTKDENGLPKVFYHGTYSKFRVFRRVGKASQQGFFFTPSQKATEEYGDITLNAFLNIKNPFRADELKINKEADLQKWADILKLDYDKEKYESFKDLKTKLEKVKEATKKAGFKFHSASGGGVYVIDNKGRNSFINLEELDKENKRVVEAFKGLETEDIYFYYVVRNEFDLVLYALNKNDRYFHTSGRDEVKRVLEKLGYDGVVLNDTIITVFNSNQIKHIDNKGSFTDTKGNVTSKKPKDKEAEFSYFNEKSDNIYHSNPHLGAGLVGGVLNGVEQDENGNLSFDPVKFAMGFLGGSVGSFALKKGFQILEKNPELKEKIINELAHTLAQGFEKAREKYSLLNLLEPRYIVKNEKGRKIQAKTMLKELQREQKGLYNVAFNGKNAVLIKKDLEAVDEAILFEKGTKRKGGKHIRLAHSIEPSQEGYVTKQEVANLGVNIREYLKNYEPFIDKNGARLYEWKDENGVKFRAVVNNTQTSGGNSHLPSASEEIITFYSDRNLKEKMNFKNPLLKDTIAQASMQGEALSKELESKEANTHTLREQTKELLKPFTHKLIKNKNDNTKAIVTMSGIKEMLSAKAINQSVKNGFKAKQHIKAVMALPTLFENAVFKDKQAQRHFKDYVEAYRVYSADFEGGKAIISVQERKIGNDVLYFLKLDELRLNNA
ncbi:DUF3519 domain-containing protein, partial [Campylobacter upsaliensis]|nr:DUF3519 domain-containing protein [Campylobacter upsaliensis]